MFNTKIKQKRIRRMKYYPNGSVLFVTSSIEEGLLLLSNPLCRAVIESALASAQSLYPVKICHLLIEATHIHLVCVVNNPDDMSQFMKCFKTETAHAFNRILGRKKRTVWCEGSDDPVILTPVRALIAIAYLYANPSKDNLESSIDEYPGFSTWEMFASGKNSKEFKRIRRPQYQRLETNHHNLRGYTEEANRLLNETDETLPFSIDPDAWLKAFGITEKSDRDRMNSRLVDRIRHLEERAKLKRKRLHQSIIGKEKLIRQRIDLTYRPIRTGRKMWCLSEKRCLRVKFVSFLKDLMSAAREVRKRWFQGDFTLPYPPGLFPPSLPKLANALNSRQKYYDHEATVGFVPLLN